MRPLAAIGGTVEDANRARALADAVALLRERATTYALSAGGVGAAQPFDGPGAKRARRTFGLRGGELCGCGEGGCWPCASDGTFGADVCACAAAGCAECLPPWALPRGLAAAQRKTASNALFTPGFLGGDFASPSYPYVCAHSHAKPTTVADFVNTLDPFYRGTTEIDERLTRLHDMRAENGIDQLVLSVMAGEDVDAALEGYPLDVVALYARFFEPDFFLPFVRGFDIDAPNLAWIELCLKQNFRGIGELFCYGYSNELGGPATLVEVLRVAARYFVPVAVHWEFGNRNPDPPPSSDDPMPPPPRTEMAVTWERLTWLLNQFPNLPLETYARGSEDDPLPVKVIICHCGSGPLAEDEALVPEYAARLDTLLSVYPNVYFDLAGMQGPEGAVLYRLDGRRPILTALGAVIADRMQRYPERFLFGIDAMSTTAAELDRWTGTIPNYTTFLDAGGITDATTVAAYQKQNAYRVLYARAPDLSGTASTSGTGWDGVSSVEL